MPKRTSASTGELRSALVEHARNLVHRDGSEALTMRALAAEAGCALGLPYKVFSDRGDLVAQILRTELERLASAGETLIAGAGNGTVAANLAGYAKGILDSPAVALAGEVKSDEVLAARFVHEADQTGTGPGGFQTVFARYLAAEREQARVGTEVDIEAMAFLLAGAVHNLVVSGPAYPRPGRDQFNGYLEALADLIRPR